MPDIIRLRYEGCIRSLCNNGLRVPRDVSVMGFDGLTPGSFLVSQLSTVIRSRQCLAHRSVEILIEQTETSAPAASTRTDTDRAALAARFSI